MELAAAEVVGNAFIRMTTIRCSASWGAATHSSRSPPPAQRWGPLAEPGTGWNCNIKAFGALRR